MGVFETEYKRLDDEQRQAVDLIPGPVMVIAGPGSGKTQLLGMRVANILKKTDVEPANILCLTYSESGEQAIRRRLIKLLGATGYKVPVYTFHAFGSDIMARYPEYFYRGADYALADDLKQYELLQSIFSEFNHDHLLYGFREHRFTQLQPTTAKIHEFKKAGYSPENVRSILAANDAFLNFSEPILDSFIGNQTITAKLIQQFPQMIKQLENFTQKGKAEPFIEPLQAVFMTSLNEAIKESAALSGRDITKPFTRFKAQWRDSGFKSGWQFLARSQHAKLKAVTAVYEQYEALLNQQQLFDYEDMIAGPVRELERNEQLRAQLQEQYLYILVDEYQDTNQAQLRLIRTLTDHPVNEGQPNIMVVGDDDQAIYKFQGADINNMLEFERHYPAATLISLISNYRSHQKILDLSRAVIIQATERLENLRPNITKKLTAKASDLPPQVIMTQPLFNDQVSEYHWVAKTIQALVQDGMPPGEIAVFGRHHRDLVEVVPHLMELGLSVDYERRENILESEHIVRLLHLATLVKTIAEQQWREADALFPEILSYEFFDLPNELIWEVAFTAFQKRQSWLEVLHHHSNPKLQVVAKLCMAAASAAASEPLEHTLDLLLGVPTRNDPEVISPYYHYYFGDIARSPDGAYLTLLSQLITLRRHLQEYKKGDRLKLEDLLNFVHLHAERKLGIIDNHIPDGSSDAVQVMTAHKAKGLEFQAVFVLHCLEPVWGKPTRPHSKHIKYPQNLMVLEPAGDTIDDWLRLFYVALTRARSNLYLPAFSHYDDGSEAMALSFLETEEASQFISPTAQPPEKATELVKTYETQWQARHYLAACEDKQRFAPRLEDYRLSITHLDNFLDLQYAGPEVFVARHLLRFPGAPSLNTAFGSAMHGALSEVHRQVNEKQHVYDPGNIDRTFKAMLHGERLRASDEERALSRGKERLEWLLDGKLDFIKPGQLSEQSFGKHPVTIGSVRLTGKVDALSIAGNDIIVTDYKTGRPAINWSLEDSAKLSKLYRYKRQLVFYKILVEASGLGQFSGKKVSHGELVFLEPVIKSQELLRLSHEITSEEVERLKRLMTVVWTKIMAMDFPDVSKYPADLKGIIAFENDLLDTKI